MASFAFPNKGRRERETAALVARFDPHRHRLLVIDFSAHMGDRPYAAEYGMDPANLVVLPDGRRIHTRMFRLKRSEFSLNSQSVPPVPVLEDPHGWKVIVPMPDSLEVLLSAATLPQGQVDLSTRGFDLTIHGGKLIRERESVIIAL